MYIDINNTLNVNIKLAQVCGLNAAVYWAGLVEVSKKVVKKSTYNDLGFFYLDREYMTKITTLSIEQQKECDKILSSVGVVEESSENKDYIRVNFEAALSLIIEDDAKKLQGIVKLTKSKTKEEQKLAKRLSCIGNMSTWLTSGTTNQDLILAYTNWAESIYDKYGAQTKTNTLNFRSKIEAATSDVCRQIKIINYAAVKQYREADWAINAINADTKNYSVNINQKQYNGVNTTTIFQ